MEGEKLPETLIAFLGIALGARGIDAAREYAATLGEEKVYSQVDCLMYVVERLGISGADLDRLLSDIQARETLMIERGMELERRSEEAKRIEDRLESLENRMTEILVEVRQIEDERRQLVSELRSLAPDHEIPD